MTYTKIPNMALREEDDQDSMRKFGAARVGFSGRGSFREY